MNPLKTLWTKLKDLLKKVPESSPLNDKASALITKIDSDVAAYQKQLEKHKGQSGKSKGFTGRDLAKIGRSLRGHVLELSKLLDEVSDKDFLSSIAPWRKEVERVLNDELGQQIRVASSRRVVALYLGFRN